MTATITEFPKRYTSYRVVFMLFPNTPKVVLTLQCPHDKLDDALLTIMQLPQEEVCFYEVHGHAPDGKIHVLRGDINAKEPAGSYTVNHKSLVFPGSTLIKDIGSQSNKIITDYHNKQASQKIHALRTATTTPPSPTPEAAEVKAIVDAALNRAAATPPNKVDEFKVVRTVSTYIENFQ